MTITGNFQHKTIHVCKEALIKTLGQLSREGWELVKTHEYKIETTGATAFQMFLKRPMNGGMSVNEVKMFHAKLEEVADNLEVLLASFASADHPDLMSIGAKHKLVATVLSDVRKLAGDTDG